jgi:hypothetical protein
MHELMHLMGLCGEPHPSLLLLAAPIIASIKYVKSLIQKHYD